MMDNRQTPPVPHAWSQMAPLKASGWLEELHRRPDPPSIWTDRIPPSDPR